MSDLKEFYETQIRAKSPNMPAFENADKATLLSVEKSITFAGWKCSRAVTKLKEALNRFLQPNTNKSKFHK